jgi:hypothetical protein
MKSGTRLTTNGVYHHDRHDVHKLGIEDKEEVETTHNSHFKKPFENSTIPLNTSDVDRLTRSSSGNNPRPAERQTVRVHAI